MKLAQPRRGAGTLLLETLIAMSIFTAISICLLMGFTSLERNFAATSDFATNHTDAVRITPSSPCRLITRRTVCRRPRT